MITVAHLTIIKESSTNQILDGSDYLNLAKVNTVPYMFTATLSLSDGVCMSG